MEEDGGTQYPLRQTEPTHCKSSSHPQYPLMQRSLRHWLFSVQRPKDELLPPPVVPPTLSQRMQGFVLPLMQTYPCLAQKSFPALPLRAHASAGHWPFGKDE